MSKNLVTYFSASGVTKEAAQRLAKAVSADIAEITPVEPYSTADVDWRNPDSRASKENADTSARPEIKDLTANVADYDTVFVGFPVWWNVEPRAVDTFLEKYDFSGKRVVPFATSGGSTIDGSVERVKSVVKGATVTSGKVIVAQDGDDDIKNWADTVLG